MKKRLRNKYRKRIVCSHLTIESVEITNDPYSMYEDFLVCKIDCNHWEQSQDEPKTYDCDYCNNCPNYTISKCAMRNYLQSLKADKHYYSGLPHSPRKRKKVSKMIFQLPF